MKTAYINGSFFTMNDKFDVHDNGMMVTDNTDIIYIGEKNDDMLQRVDKVVDLDGKWVLPGLVNAHSHIHMTIMRGIGDDMLLQPWLEEKIWPIEQKFTKEIGKVSTLLGALEMLKGGTTSFSDMYNPVCIDIDEIMNELDKVGIRGALSHTIFSSGTDEDRRINLQEAERVARKYNSYADGRLTTMVAPHSPYACTPEALEESARIAKENDIMVHIHLSETNYEIKDIEQRYGARPVEHVRRTGIFDQPTIIAHGVVLNDEERAMLREHGVSVAHNPNSNLKLGSGIADIVKMLEANVQVGIATDGVASNNNYDMFEEMRIAALLQKGVYYDATKLPAETVLQLGTRIGAKAIGMPHTGSLEQGKKADFITIDAKNKPHLQPVDAASSHLLYAASGHDVSDVFIDGKEIVRAGECLTIDEERIIAEANRLKAYLV